MKQKSLLLAVLVFLSLDGTFASFHEASAFGQTNQGLLPFGQDSVLLEIMSKLPVISDLTDHIKEMNKPSFIQMANKLNQHLSDMIHGNPELERVYTRSKKFLGLLPAESTGIFLQEDFTVGDASSIKRSKTRAKDASNDMSLLPQTFSSSQVRWVPYSQACSATGGMQYDSTAQGCVCMANHCPSGGSIWSGLSASTYPLCTDSTAATTDCGWCQPQSGQSCGTCAAVSSGARLNTDGIFLKDASKSVSDYDVSDCYNLASIPHTCTVKCSTSGVTGDEASWTISSVDVHCAYTSTDDSPAGLPYINVVIPLSITSSVCSCVSCSSTEYRVDCQTCAPCVDQSTCPAGTWVDGTDTECTSGVRCIDCEPGHYQSASGGASTCNECQPGTYQDQAKQTACQPCPSGLVSVRAKQTQCTSCQSGYYASSASSCSTCHSCVATSEQTLSTCSGSADSRCACANGYSGVASTATTASSCVQCSAGTFSSCTSASCSCSDCASGSYSTTGQSSCTACSSGTFSASGASECTSCKACSLPGQEISVACTLQSDTICQCIDQYYESGGSCHACSTCDGPTKQVATSCTATADATCECSPGYYGDGSGTCLGCSVCDGEGREVGSACTPTSNTVCVCSAGYAGDGASCAACQAGQYAASGSSTCTECVGSSASTGGEFTLSSTTACATCSACGAGYEVDTPCTSSSDRTCTPCAAGSYALESEATCTACPGGTGATDGSYAASSTIACTACTDCEATQSVSTACSSTTNRVCAECQANSYASNGICVNCEPSNQASGGTYTSLASSPCQPCTACSRTQKIVSDCVGGSDRQCETCPAGTFVSSDARSCTSCEATTAASGGTFTTTQYATVCTDCAACGAGFGVNAQCTLSSDRTCQECAAGSFALESDASCTTCVGGSQSASGGQFTTSNQVACSDCASCGAGFEVLTHCSSTADRTCQACSVGSYATSSMISCETCEPGSETATSSGYFSTATDQECQQCTTCGAGSGMDSPCTSGSDRVCVECNIGTYALAESTSCVSCEAPTDGAGGTFTLDQATPCQACTECVAGEIMTTDCTPSSDRVCEACSLGSYSLAGATSCTVCDAGPASEVEGGEFAPSTDVTSCSACTACVEGQKLVSSCTSSADRVCAACDAGYYQSSAGATCMECTGAPSASVGGKFTADSVSCNDCTDCAAGEQVAQQCTGTQDRTCSACAPGSRSSVGETSCEVCSGDNFAEESSGGTFTLSADAPQCDDCTKCGAGERVESQCSSSSDRTCEACPDGSYSLDGDVACTECQGSSNAYGGSFTTSSTVECEMCATCGAGFGVASECTSTTDRTCIECTSGEYALDGDTSCTACVAGESFSISTTAACQSCTECPDGSRIVAACTPSSDLVYEACGPGSVSSADKTSCVACVDGSTYANAEGNACEACSVCEEGFGELSPCTANSNRACEVCPPGSYGRDGGTCVACPGGDAGSEDGGSYTSRADATECTPCTTCEAVTQYVIQQCSASTDRTCGECNPCATESFIVRPCDAVTDTGCQGCSSQCSPGQFEAVACTQTSDRECQTCSSCQANEFVIAECFAASDTVCQECTVCSETEFLVSECGDEADRVCEQCRTCGDNEYQVSDCTATSNRVCASCGVACGPNQFEVQECTHSQPRVCQDCETCGDNEYQSQACQAASDVECSPCTTCGFYQSFCSQNSDAVCGVCSTCESGTFESSSCNGSSDRVCSSCASECQANIQFEATPCTSETNRVCDACTVCSASQYQTGGCDGLVDTVCQDCLLGGPELCSENEFAVSCQDSSYIRCVACSGCEQNHYEQQSCSGFQDSVCAACQSTCPSGYYASESCPNGGGYVCTACGGGCPENQYYFESLCTSSNDGCVACSASCQANEFQTHTCSGGSGYLCASCQTCSAGKFEQSGCTDTSDAVCVSGCTSECGEGTYEDTSIACAEDYKFCRSCSQCPDDSYPAGGCTGGDSDTLCELCNSEKPCDQLSGQYYEKARCANSYECLPCTECANEIVLAECSATHDTVCAICGTEECENGMFRNERCDSGWFCDGCNDPCGEDEYVIVECSPSGTSAGECGSCECVGDSFATQSCKESQGPECATCVTCNSDQFIERPCDPESGDPGACGECTPCAAGQDNDCFTNLDATAAGSCSFCATCSEGTFSPHGCGDCQAWQVCGAGQYQTEAPSSSNDRSCETCATCAANEYQSVECSSDKNTQCTTCSTSCPAGEYDQNACGPDSANDAQCAPCATCDGSSYVVSDCTTHSNTVCGTCSCAAGTYMVSCASTGVGRGPICQECSTQRCPDPTSEKSCGAGKYYCESGRKTVDVDGVEGPSHTGENVIAIVASVLGVISVGVGATMLAFLPKQSSTEQYEALGTDTPDGPEAELGYNECGPSACALMEYEGECCQKFVPSVHELNRSENQYSRSRAYIADDARTDDGLEGVVQDDDQDGLEQQKHTPEKAAGNTVPKCGAIVAIVMGVIGFSLAIGFVANNSDLGMVLGSVGFAFVMMGLLSAAFGHAGPMITAKFRSKTPPKEDDGFDDLSNQGEGESSPTTVLVAA